MKHLLSLPATILLAAVATTCAAADFEQPADEMPATSLAAAQVAGESFHVQDPVHSDGLMHHYVVQSRFGDFPAYGQAALTVRLHEVAALETLSKTSDTNVVLEAAMRGVKEDVQTAVRIAKSPVKTVTGIPRGISHLLGGYRAEAQDVTRRAGEAVHDSGPRSATGKALGKQTEQMAREYADRYLGLSEAERRWYEKLGVDPYTNNEV